MLTCTRIFSLFHCGKNHKTPLIERLKTSKHFWLLQGQRRRKGAREASIGERKGGGQKRRDMSVEANDDRTRRTKSYQRWAWKGRKWKSKEKNGRWKEWEEQDFHITFVVGCSELAVFVTAPNKHRTTYSQSDIVIGTCVHCKHHINNTIILRLFFPPFNPLLLPLPSFLTSIYWTL